MNTVLVPALKSFEFRGRVVTVGESVPMSPLEAAVAARRGEVSLTRGYRTAAMVPAPQSAPEPEAATEPTREPEPELEPEASAPAGAPRRSRRYRRRDLVAADPQLETLETPQLDTQSTQSTE